MTKWISPLKKTIVIPLAGVFVAWLIGKVLDAYFSLTILTSIWSWVVATVSWLKQEVPMPLWLLLGVTITGLGVIVMLVYMVAQMRRLEKEIDQLRHPATIPLSDFQRSVLMTIAGFLDNDVFPTDQEIRKHLVSSAIPVHAALDVLSERNLISDEMLTDGSSFIDLTASGRKYVLDHKNSGKSPALA
jgi:hypothetical protein